jgi:hypothetical protein
MTRRREDHDWLLLLHQLPAKPAYLRVKVWRRMQGLGAVAIRNGVYALPANAETREDFTWLLREIREGGGDGLICEARLLEGLADEDVVALFNAARDADYRTVREALEALVAADVEAEATARLSRLRERLGEIRAIDFFAAEEGRKADALAALIEARLKEDTMPGQRTKAAAETPMDALRGKTWVTRRDVHIDRIASAWLIRRFIDPKARFRFVGEKHGKLRPDEIRFDMFAAEFTHEGDRCTFEVLIERCRLKDPALRRIGEIVHDIDLKDGKFARAEAAGVAQVIDGVIAATGNDEQRIARGGAVFDDLHAAFARRRRGA